MKRWILVAVVIANLTIGVHSVQAQVKIGSNPTVADPTLNLEVEASTPDRKVKVNKTTGQVTIQDGTEGTQRVLTSDAVGGASWQELKTTSMTSFQQALGVTAVLPTTVGSGYCDANVPPFAPPACATNLNMSAAFTTTKSVNDVSIDFNTFYSVYGNDQSVAFNFICYMDKTTPGVLEIVGNYYTTVSASTPAICSGNNLFTRFVLKNLPPRTYNVYMFLTPWVNPGAPATLGVGLESGPSCGVNATNNYLIVSISQ